MSTTTTLRAVNFEFALSRFSEALTHLATNGLIEPTGLHLHSTAQWSNDSELQCCATAWTSATDEQWSAYCETFNQDCVAIASQKWINAYNPDTPVPDDFLDLFAAGTVGPKPWPFNGEYFVIPSTAKHITG